MKKRFLWFAFYLFIVGRWVWPAQAQSPCTHVIFRIDTAVSLDQQAICDAAKSWGDDGYRVLIYLTDEAVGSEEAWFDLLDQIEVAAGLRDAGQEDSFSRNGLAIEAATTAALWNPTITYGESLFDTKLDTDETAVTQLKNDL
ncbi:MAG: hypothetical protein KC419_15115, partial [Anaerolineales bacterium]|nr:hypothetical protein [Anaerolineales bacterium]